MADLDRNRMARLGGAGLVAMASSQALAQFDAASLTGPDGGPKVTLSLIADEGELAPGGTLWLGVRYEIIDGWHLYWHGQNDTGFAPEFAISAPPGFEVGEALWPAPHRHEMPGAILDHIYEHELTILVPVKAPMSLGDADDLQFGVKSDWLVCEAMCIPEEGDAVLTLSSGPVRPEPSVRRSFKDARARLPVRFDSDVARSAGLIVRCDPDKSVEFEIPGARSMSFYPGPSCAMIENLIEVGAVQGSRMRLTPDDGGEVCGVLEATTNDGKTLLFAIGPSGSTAERRDE